MGCIVLGSESRYQVSARLSQPNPPSPLLNTQATIDTHQTLPKIYWGLFLAIKNLKPPNIFLFFLSPSAQVCASQGSRWLELEHWKHQVHTNCRNDHIRAANVTERDGDVSSPRSGWYSSSVLSSSAPIHHPSTCTDLSPPLNWDKGTHVGENPSKIRRILRSTCGVQTCCWTQIGAISIIKWIWLDDGPNLIWDGRSVLTSRLCSCKHQDNGDNDGGTPANKHDQNREDRDQLPRITTLGTGEKLSRTDSQLSSRDHKFQKWTSHANNSPVDGTEVSWEDDKIDVQDASYFLRLTL